MTTACIQFYYKYLWGARNRRILSLQNGFSSVWERANPIWVRTKSLAPVELPVEADIYYVSAWSYRDVSTVIDWAVQYPDCQFIIGGPSAWFIQQAINYKKFQPPANVKITIESVESALNVDYCSKDWKIELPQSDESLCLYSYHLGDLCYWDKCTFCTGGIRCHSTEVRESYDVEQLWSAPRGIIWISSPAIPPEKLDLLGELDHKHKEYCVFIRGEEAVYRALKRILPTLPGRSSIAFHIGIEFPSNKMLKQVDKGVTKEEISKVINLIYEEGQVVSCSLLTNLKNVRKEDLQEAKEFFQSIRYKGVPYIRYHYRDCINFTATGDRPYSEWNIHMGYYDTLLGEDEYYNSEWIKLLTESGAHLVQARRSVE